MPVRLSDRDALGEAAEPVCPCAAEDLITQVNAARFRADRDDSAREIVAQDERHPAGQDPLERPSAQPYVERNDARSGNRHHPSAGPATGSGNSRGCSAALLASMANAFVVRAPSSDQQRVAPGLDVENEQGGTRGRTQPSRTVVQRGLGKGNASAHRDHAPRCTHHAASSLKPRRYETFSSSVVWPRLGPRLECVAIPQALSSRVAA